MAYCHCRNLSSWANGWDTVDTESGRPSVRRTHAESAASGIPTRVKSSAMSESTWAVDSGAATTASESGAGVRAPSRSDHASVVTAITRQVARGTSGSPDLHCARRQGAAQHRHALPSTTAMPLLANSTDGHGSG